MTVAAPVKRRMPVAKIGVLQLNRSTHEGTIAQSKSPRQMRGAADADAFIRHDVERRARVCGEAVARIGTKIPFVIMAGDPQCLCDFARARAKLAEIVHATTPLHRCNPSSRLERTN